MNVDLKQLPIPEDVAAILAKPLPRYYRARAAGQDYDVFVARDDIGGDGPPDVRWHVSVSGEKIAPWASFVAIVHKVRPGVTFAIPLPVPTQWVNLDPNCIQAWEIHDTNAVAQWRFEGEAGRDTPS